MSFPPSGEPKPRRLYTRQVTSPMDVVHLDPDHPGFRDPEYRARRNAIAQLALRYQRGTPVPEVSYTPEETEVWRTVWKHLAPLHARYASREYLESSHEVALSKERIPQLREVNLQLGRASGFSMLPVA